MKPPLIDQANKDEERLDSFFNLLFGVDSGVMVFLMVVKGDKLGESTFPFQLAFYPFESQIVILAVCALTILLLRGLNLLCHDKPWFRNLTKWLALVLLVISVAAIVCGGWTLHQNPDFLPGGK